MISFFWKRGYYFSQYFYNYKINYTLYHFMQHHYAASTFFIKLLVLRCEFSTEHLFTQWQNNLLDRKPIISYSRSISLITQFNLFKFLLNFLIVSTYPVLVDFRLTEVFHLLIYYLLCTYKGISLYINRPLYRRTRGRTFSPGKKKIHMMHPLLKYWWGLNKIK